MDRIISVGLTKTFQLKSGQTVQADTTGFSIYGAVFTYDQRVFDLLPGTDTLVKTVLDGVGLEGDPAAVMLQNAGNPPEVALSGDSMSNWTLSVKEGEGGQPALKTTLDSAQPVPVKGI